MLRELSISEVHVNGQLSELPSALRDPIDQPGESPVGPELRKNQWSLLFPCSLQYDDSSLQGIVEGMSHTSMNKFADLLAHRGTATVTVGIIREFIEQSKK